MSKMMEFVSDGVENIVGKGENAGNQHFLHFPQCFQKSSTLRSSNLDEVFKGLALGNSEKGLFNRSLKKTVHSMLVYILILELN